MENFIVIILKILSVSLFATVVTGNMFGIFKKQVGRAIVWATWKGIQYFRQFPKYTYSRSVAQGNQRVKFTAYLRVAQSCLTTIIQKFWKKLAVKQSGFNAFMHYNTTVDAFAFNPVTMIFSKGGLTPGLLTTAIYDVITGRVTFTWPTTLSGNQTSTDTAVMVVYDKNRVETFVKDIGTLRSAGTETVTVGPTLDFNDLFAYIFFYRDLGTQIEKISNSVYKEVTE